MSNQAAKAGVLAALMIGTTAATTGIVPTPIAIPGIENRAEAQSISANVDFGSLLNKIINMGRNFWSNYYGASFIQTYFGYFPPDAVQRIKQQYGTSANSYFWQECKNGFYRRSNAQWWQKAIIDPFAWFFFVQREEGGQVNCYVRYPR